MNMGEGRRAQPLSHEVALPRGGEFRCHIADPSGAELCSDDFTEVRPVAFYCYRSNGLRELLVQDIELCVLREGRAA